MIILSLGSNLSSKFGDRFKNLEIAMNYLEGYGILIEKKSSPIDTSYFFYAVNFPPTNKLVEGYFEFFPPSHLLLKKGTHQFDNLACWK